MDESKPHSDEALAERTLGGDQSAFTELIERYHDPLLGFLVRFLSSRERAEDVFQETFLQVHQSLDKFDTTKRFKPWLFTIAANKARDLLRREKRRQGVSLDAPIGGSDEGGGASMVDLLAISLPPVETELEIEERSKLVQRAVNELSDMQREVLLLSYFQKLSYQELAEFLDIPIGTVKSRLHGAVAAFGRKLKSALEEGSRTEEQRRRQFRLDRDGA